MMKEAERCSLWAQVPQFFTHFKISLPLYLVVRVLYLSWMLDLVLLGFTLLYITDTMFFLLIEGLSNTALNKSIDAIFLTLFAHFVSRFGASVFHTFSFLLFVMVIYNQ